MGAQAGWELSREDPRNQKDLRQASPVLPPGLERQETQPQWRVLDWPDPELSVFPAMAAISGHLHSGLGAAAGQETQAG